MASQEYLDKMQGRQNFRNLWHTDLMGTIQADTRCKLLLRVSNYRFILWLFFFFFSFFFLGFCSFCLSTQLFSALSDRLFVFCGCLSADCCFAFWWWVLGSVVYFRFSVIQIWFCFYFGVLICLSYHDCCCEAMFYCLGWHGISQL